MSLDDWNNASLSAVLQRSTQALAQRLRVALPGQIVRFNPVTQTATVQPLIQQKRNDGSLQPLPVLQDVPVSFPRGGGFVITFPVAAGDECELIFQDRCMDAWFQSGRASEPVDYRLHDLSDAVACVGIASLPNVIPRFEMDGVVLRTLDGRASFKLDTAGVLTLRGTKLVLDLPVEFTQGLRGHGDVVSNSIGLETHTHDNVENGPGQTGPAQ
ncbi:Gp138 family membrane-puncturing spike protein [Xylella fastidiosa subsp. sandyi]